jgi:hypothetical protein
MSLKAAYLAGIVLGQQSVSLANSMPRSQQFLSTFKSH